MSATTRRRLDAGTGAAFVVLITVALALPGQPPRAEDSIATLTTVLIEHRRAFLLSAVALLVERGPFQFGGVFDVAGAIPALLWIAALSVVMVRGVSAGTAQPQRAAARAS